MKNLSQLCILLLLVLSSVNIEQALAEDFMVGTVLSANLAKKEIIVIPFEDGSSVDTVEGEKSVVARLSTDNLVVDRMGGKVFPGCVYPGGIIRLWGRMDEKAKVFLITEIRGWGGRGRHDPTGVRRRLQRGRAMNCPGGPGFCGGQ